MFDIIYACNARVVVIIWQDGLATDFVIASSPSPRGLIGLKNLIYPIRRLI